MAALTEVALQQRGAATSLVVDRVQRVDGLVDAADFGDGLRQTGWPLFDLQCAHDALSFNPRQELLVIHPPGLVAAAVLYLRKVPRLVQRSEAPGARVGWPNHSLEVRLHLVVPSPVPAPAK
jgi:hypothetical protein